MQLDEECPKPLDKYELLTQIAATNVTLLYYVLIRHLEDLAPIVYTCAHPNARPVKNPWSHPKIPVTQEPIQHVIP